MTIEKGLFADNVNQQRKTVDHPSAQSNQPLEFPENDNYLAFNLSRVSQRQTRLDIRRRDGTGCIIYYGYIATIEYSGNEIITLIYQNSVFTITGKNLKKLRDALQDERVRYIQEAMINTHVDPEQPIVESIEQTHLGEEG